MIIQIELTKDQEAALTRSNTDELPLDVFALAVITQRVNEHVDAWRQRDSDEVRALVSAIPSEKLDEAKAALKAL